MFHHIEKQLAGLGCNSITDQSHTMHSKTENFKDIGIKLIKLMATFLFNFFI